MGQLINIRCKKCDFDRNAKIGVGVLDFNLDNITRKFNPIIKYEIKELKENHTIEKYNYNCIIVKCDRCKEIFSQPFLTITYDNNKEYIYGDKCMICGEKAEHIKVEELNKCNCSKCFGELEIRNSGYWD